MEELNTVNDVQSEVVDAQEEANPVNDGQSGDVDAQEGAGSEEEQAEKGKQSADLNRIYAQARRSAEAAASARMGELNEVLRELQSYGYSGTPEEIATALRSARTGQSVEEIRAGRQREAMERAQQVRRDPEFLRLSAENRSLKEKAFRDIYDKDLRELKRADPDLKAEGISELGEQYLKMRSMGVDNMTAYLAVKGAKESAAKKKPPVIGAVNSSAGKVKDYYSPAEVDKLSDKDLSDPKIWERVRKSMLRWK